MPSPIAGTYVRAANHASRESQEVRHWVNARRARSGRPRWNAEETRPALTSARERRSAAAKAGPCQRAMTVGRPIAVGTPSAYMIP